jgi:hypothetical protein
MKKQLQLKGDEMRERIEAELAKRKQERESLRGQQQQLTEQLNKCVELIVMQNGAIEQLEMLLKEDQAEEVPA